MTQVARPNPPNFGPGFVSKFSENVYASSTFCFEGLSGLEMLRCLFFYAVKIANKEPFSSFRQCSEGSVRGVAPGDSATTSNAAEVSGREDWGSQEV